MKWLRHELEKDFRITADGQHRCWVTVLGEPKTEALQEHAGRKGTLDKNFSGEHVIYDNFVREF